VGKLCGFSLFIAVHVKVQRQQFPRVEIRFTQDVFQRNNCPLTAIQVYWTSGLRRVRHDD